jgi:fatty acid-binding protein DegV
MGGRVGERPVHVIVMHAQASNDADDLSRRVQDRFDCREVFVSEFTPVMGAHLGPGLLGLAFYSDP